MGAMYRRIRQRFRDRVLPERSAGPNFVPEADDVMLVSYPRSGNTWLRFMLATLLDPAVPATFLDIENRVADIYVAPANRIRVLPKPRLIKSHQSFDPTYRRVVYIVRDPRDVAPSYLRYLKRMGELPPHLTLADYIPMFLYGKAYRDAFGLWGDHVDGWTSQTKVDDLLVVRYEDLLDAPSTHLADIARFIGIPADARRIDLSISSSNPDHLRRMEASQIDGSETLRGSNVDMPFIGSATKGAGAQSLSNFEEALFFDAIGDTMKRFSYWPIHQ